MGLFNKFKKAAISNRLEETILYEIVLDEIEKGIKIRGLWGKAFANSDGDTAKANSLYMKYRVQDIKDFFTTMKIAYEEISKEQILHYISENKDIESLSENKENIFLEKHGCNLNSINVSINNNVIFVRKRKIYYCFDRKLEEEYIREIQ